MFRRCLPAALCCAAPLLAAENRVAPPADVSGRTFVLTAAETETMTPEAVVGEAEPTRSRSAFAGMELRIGPNNGKGNKAHRGEPEYRVLGNVGQISFWDDQKGSAYIVLYFETPESGSAVLSYELPGATRRHSGIRFTVK